MKWMLFVLVFGTHPVETNLLFDSLDACLKAEETMRTEYARAYSQGTWGNGGRGERSLRGQQVWAENHGNLHPARVMIATKARLGEEPRRASSYSSRLR